MAGLVDDGKIKQVLPDDAGQRIPSGRPAIRRGDICRVSLPVQGGSGHEGVRPVLVIQNDTGNEFGLTTIVAPVTSGAGNHDNLLNVTVPEGVLPKASSVRLNQLLTLEKSRIGERMVSLSRETMARVDEALRVSLGLPRLP
ncbi:MAG: type II toxin-antitoxin system PemK/MazF family toxin [Thermoleophilia bacterium]